MFDRWINWLESNIISMVLALLLALAVWIVATQQENPIQQTEFSRPIPIQLIGLSSDLIVTNEPPTTTAVQVRAPRNTLTSLSVEDFSVIADLSGLEPGNYQIPLQIEVAAQAIPVSANPSHIQIDIEKVAQREMPVQLVLDGQLPTGYATGSSQLQPATVQINGPQSRVALISEVRVSVALDGLREAYEGDLPLTALDSSGNPVTGVTIKPETVHVTLPIQQEEGFKDVAVIARPVGQPPPGYFVTNITVTPPVVTVQGDPAVISAMLPYILTSVDVTTMIADTSVEITLQLPAGVTLSEAQPIQALVTVAAQLGSRTLSVPVTVDGLGPGLAGTVNPTNVDVLLSGPLPVLNALTPETVLVTVDVTDRAIGTYQLEPTAQVTNIATPEKVLVESVLPQTVEVQITQNVNK